MTDHVSIRRRVRFVETDAAGIVHYSNFFRFMEEAEVEFWRSIGQPAHPVGNGGTMAWPRVEATCQYFHPLRFDDLFEVRLRIAERKARSLTFSFHIVKMNGEESQIVARGRITAVCVAVDAATGRMNAIAIPPEIASRLPDPKPPTTRTATTEER